MLNLFTEKNIDLLKCPASMFFAVGLGVVAGSTCSVYLQQSFSIHPILSNLAITILFYLCGVGVAHVVSFFNNIITTSGARTLSWLDSIRGLIMKTKIALTFNGKKKILRSFNSLSKIEQEELIEDLADKIRKSS